MNDNFTAKKNCYVLETVTEKHKYSLLLKKFVIIKYLPII